MYKLSSEKQAPIGDGYDVYMKSMEWVMDQAKILRALLSYRSNNMIKNNKTLEELMKHIDGCFKIWITEKDRKTIVCQCNDKWDIPEEIEKEIVDNWICCEKRVKVCLDR